MATVSDMLDGNIIKQTVKQIRKNPLPVLATDVLANIRGQIGTEPKYDLWPQS